MNKTRFSLLVTGLCIFCFGALGQSGQAGTRGIVVDEKQLPVAAASVLLLNATDSALVKIIPTDNNGNFFFEGLKEGRYYISVTSVGFLQLNTVSFDLANAEDLTHDTIRLIRQTNTLAAVTVRNNKPLIQVQPDRMILNVSAGMNATGSNALELLRKSPLVRVDNNNGLSIHGKNGVNVFVDGKPVNISGNDLAILLVSIPSANIEAIEIITNPSAKYPAAGNAGIVNIRLKKNKAYGFNGNTSLTTSFGYTAKYNASTNFNYRNQSLNIFGSYGYRYGDNRVISSLFKTLQDDNAANIFDQHSIIENRDDSHNFKAGIDFFLSKKSTLGVMVNGNLNYGPMYIASTTKIYRTPAKLDSALEARNEQKKRIRRANYNINYQYKDTLGRTLNVDADYSIFRGNTNIFQPNQYISSGNVVIRNNDVRTTAFTDIGIGSFKIDYEQNALKGKLGFGVFSNNVKTTNDFKYYNVSPGNDTLNQLRSRSFAYQENINAGYFAYSREFKKLSVNLGLRGEATGAKGNLTAITETSYRKLDTSYFNLFPSASIGYKINDNHSVNLNYGRRIDRPGYEDLNPFESPLDELTYIQGNTFVRPQFTNNLQLSYTFKQITADLMYSKTKDYFTKVLDTTGYNRIVQTIKNITSQQVFNLNISAQIRVNKWWDVFANTSVNKSSYKGKLNASFLDVSMVSFSAYAENNFTIGKQWSVDLAGYYNGPWLDATSRWNRNWSLDWGLQKRILKENGKLKLTVTDVFNTSVEGGLINYSGTHIVGRFKGETRQLRLSFDYVFGKSSVEKARERSTSADVEKNRLK